LAVTALAILGGAVLAWQAGIFSARAESADPDAATGAASNWLHRLERAIGIGGGQAATYSGYVEADYVMVTRSVGGTLMRLDVARGDHVEKGAPLFGLDDFAERAARDEAVARLRQAQAQLADLQTGRRQPEVDAIVAQRAQAVAALQQSEADFQRQGQLRGARGSGQKQAGDARGPRGADPDPPPQPARRPEGGPLPAR